MMLNKVQDRMQNTLKFKVNSGFVNKYKTYLILVIFVFIVSPHVYAKKKKPFVSKIQVSQIIVGMDEIPTNSEQLIEISVKNNYKKDQNVRIKLLLTLPNRNMVSFGNKLIKVKAETFLRLIQTKKIIRLSEGEDLKPHLRMITIK